MALTTAAAFCDCLAVLSKDFSGRLQKLLMDLEVGLVPDVELEDTRNHGHCTDPELDGRRDVLEPPTAPQ